MYGVDRATELHELPSTGQNHLSMKKLKVVDGTGRRGKQLTNERAGRR